MGTKIRSFLTFRERCPRGAPMSPEVASRVVDLFRKIHPPESGRTVTPSTSAAVLYSVAKAIRSHLVS